MKVRLIGVLIEMLPNWCWISEGIWSGRKWYEKGLNADLHKIKIYCSSDNNLSSVLKA